MGLYFIPLGKNKMRIYFVFKNSIFTLSYTTSTFPLLPRGSVTYRCAKKKPYSLTVYRSSIFEFLSFFSNIYETVTPPHSARSQNTIISCTNTVENLNLKTFIWIGKLNQLLP
jgi:hypothetical protein